MCVFFLIETGGIAIWMGIQWQWAVNFLNFLHDSN
jgi:hypothetical protein